MSFWAVLYLELWRRRSEELIHRWGLVGWDQGADHPRPQYLKMLSKIKIFKAKEKLNAVTMEKEPHVSFWKVRVPATMLSFTVVIILVLTALAAVFAVVLYRMFLNASSKIFNELDFDNNQYQNFAIPISAAAMNLVSIFFLFIYLL